MFGWGDSQKEIDADKLRDYLLDYCEPAFFAGFGPALLDIVDIERADARELIRIAKRLGVDVRRFEVR